MQGSTINKVNKEVWLKRPVQTKNRTACEDEVGRPHFVLVLMTSFQGFTACPEPRKPGNCDRNI
eukprot:scaffold10157_cov162-Amphora_coffeaeformis.AAC.9